MNPCFPTTSVKFLKEWPKFCAWLISRGSESRVPSNGYELARFTTPQGVGIVHRNKIGAVTSWGGGADEAWRAWKADAEWRVGSRSKRDKNSRKRRHRIATILERDGADCFFCGHDLGDDVTLEHLVPVANGGPDHLANLFLAHNACNQDAGQISAAEKVALRDQLRASRTLTAGSAPDPLHQLHPLPDHPRCLMSDISGERPLDANASAVDDERGPNPIDVHVGSRVRLRHTLLGMSQEKLAEAIGLTFQQVQKYEKGANRISASKLWALSNILDVPVSFFFDDMPAGGAIPATRSGYRIGGQYPDPMARSETLELARNYYAIKDEGVRCSVYDLVRAAGRADGEVVAS